MINTSLDYKKAMLNGNEMHGKVQITLRNGATVNINEDMLMADGIKIEEAVSSENSFDVGSVIINKCTISLYNDEELALDKYDFNGAKVKPYIGVKLDNGNIEWIMRGTYVVDIAKNVSFGITLECLDNMAKFDKVYETELTYPATIYDVVKECCIKCEVPFTQRDFFNSGYKVNRPIGDDLTYRLVLSYAVALGCSYAKCKPGGELVIDWYNMDILGQLADGGIFDHYDEFLYRTGDELNGGNFLDYSSGAIFDAGLFINMSKYADLVDLTSQEISSKVHKITGVKSTVTIITTTEEESTEEEKLYMFGKEGYVIDFSGNPLITPTNVEEILGILGGRLVGMEFNAFNVTTALDPSIEAGDLVVITDKDSKAYQSVITGFKLDIGGSTTYTCGAKTDSDNESTRPTMIDVAKSEIKKTTDSQITAKITSYDKEVQLLTGLMSASLGAYKTEKKDSAGRTTFYLHDQNTLEKSKKIWKMGVDGFTVSTDGGKMWNAGFTAEGKAVVNLLSAIGIQFDWATGGTLTLGGANNGNGKAIIKNASGNSIIEMDSTGIKLADGASLISPNGVTGNLQFVSNGGRPYPLGECSVAGVIRGTLIICAYIPTNYVVTSAYIRLISCPAKWKTANGTVTGYSRKITLMKGDSNNSLMINGWAGSDYELAEDSFSEVSSSYSGSFASHPTGASSGSKTISSGNVKSLLKSGTMNIFMITAERASTSVTNEANYFKYFGSGLAVLDVNGYSKN